jgi:hypothetical protein
LKTNILSKLALLLVSVILMSWGKVGHEKINRNSSLSFGQEMIQFNAWTNILADHASDADYRKNSDPDESPKHYIDIDSYYGFIVTGRIPQTWDSILVYGNSFVFSNGILPWATVTTVDTLRACFQRNDWEKAVLVASDLGHYVGDGHMPLHITENYDGQLSGNSGIHSRYESSMIGNFQDMITYEGDSVEYISNVNQYVFDYIYHNYTYVDSVLEADTYAKQEAGGSTDSWTYKQALWNKTKGFTIPLFKHASHALAELIYTAWVQAGSPAISAASIFEQNNGNTVFLEQNTPNPFQNSTRINYFLVQKSPVLLQVKDSDGKVVETLINESKSAGSYSLEWKPQNVPAGLYYLILKSGESVSVKKMMVVN